MFHRRAYIFKTRFGCFNEHSGQVQPGFRDERVRNIRQRRPKWIPASRINQKMHVSPRRHPTRMLISCPLPRASFDNREVPATFLMYEFMPFRLSARVLLCLRHHHSSTRALNIESVESEMA